MRLASHPRCSEHEVLWSRLGIGRLRVVSGDLAGAIEVLAPALPLCQGDLAIYLSRVAASLGTAYAGTGRLEEGLALLRQADEHSQAIGFAFGHALALAQLAGALLLAGRPRSGARGGPPCGRYCASMGRARERSLGGVRAGDAAGRRRDRVEAERRYRDALAIAEELEIAPVLARCSDGLAGLATRPPVDF